MTLLSNLLPEGRGEMHNCLDCPMDAKRHPLSRPWGPKPKKINVKPLVEAGSRHILPWEGSIVL